jgi:hypothetical protein
LGAAALAALQLSPAKAQTFQTYRCVDGTQFIVGFYPHDPDAYLQIDGRPVSCGSAWRLLVRAIRAAA